MPKIQVDFGGFDGSFDSTFDPIPAGKYIAKVDTTKVDESGLVKANSGNFYMPIAYTIVSDMEGDTEYAGRKVFARYMTTGDGIVFTGQLLIACGLMKPTDRKLAKFDTKQIKNKSVRIVVSTREYEGKTYNDVKAVLPLGTSGDSAPTGAKGGGGSEEFENL